MYIPPSPKKSLKQISEKKIRVLVPLSALVKRFSVSHGWEFYNKCCMSMTVLPSAGGGANYDNDDHRKGSFPKTQSQYDVIICTAPKKCGLKKP